MLNIFPHRLTDYTLNLSLEHENNDTKQENTPLINGLKQQRETVP